MFPFWDLAIAPVLEKARAKKVVEIGALRGETTILMLERLGPDAELHVIDPVPEFDPSEHERQFPGRYIFHRDLSLNVLKDLEPMDAALIDGDHNWYTVYNECKDLADVARAAGAPMPVMILHDVGWPYGRRDLYYAPETIPEEHRQPYARRGMRQDKKKLLNRGGLNPTMCNAIEEGGPRNGVMTGVDDFVAGYDKPLRVIVLPIYFGLAIVVEEERLAREPELAAHLDWLESAEGRLQLMELAEDVRLKAMVFQHNVFYNYDSKLQRAADRYLDLVTKSLLDELYLENEARIGYLADCIVHGRPIDLQAVRDPARHQRERLKALRAERRAGRLAPAADDVDALPSYFPYSEMGEVRLGHLRRCLDTVRTFKVEGDLVEVGTGRGGGGIFLRAYLDAHELPDKQVWVADRFRATPADGGGEGLGGGPGFPDLLADLNTVRDAFERFGLLDERVKLLQGAPADTLPGAGIEKVALLRIGPSAGADVAAVLEALYDSVTLGGFVVVDGTHDPSVQAALDEFRTRRGITELLERVDEVAVGWQKTEHRDRPTTWATPAEARDAQTASRAPLATPAPTTRTDLSVVVVFYNMKREAARTLHSLSRAYQRNIEDLDYEVLVVENGSAPEERLGEAYVRAFGPEFRYVDLGAEATPTPVDALNRGVAEARGENIALMIDGAHVLTPGVLHYGMLGLRSYEPALVATQQWYVGPGQQPDAMLTGYEQGYEDRLFESIAWPTDGYRLFDIGHFIGDRDWFDGIWESNCIFAPRKLLEQVGAFDEAFSMPGGGYANLELYERLGSSPDIKVVTLLGEGSFHQVHGGTTTNQSEYDERRRRIVGYAQHYAEIRGRAFKGPGKPMHYIGSVGNTALRTKARWRTAPHFRDAADSATGPDGMPQTALTLPEELQREFLDAYWRTLSWRETSWMGKRIGKLPSDLVAYQELLHRVRPDWIIETRTGGGARAHFFATICDLLGHGQVVTVDAKPAPNLDHPRVHQVVGEPWDPEALAQVRALVGDDPKAVVVLGARGKRQRVMREYEAYAGFVPVGSYLIVEDTIVNGHPVWPSFGPGPAEAVKAIMNAGERFAADPQFERYGISFNPGGYLKRLT